MRYPRRRVNRGNRGVRGRRQAPPVLQTCDAAHFRGAVHQIRLVRVECLAPFLEVRGIRVEIDGSRLMTRHRHTSFFTHG